MEFHTSLSLEQIEDNFKDADVFSEIMNGLQEVAERKNEMTREILFRAKRKDNGEWVYGNLITDGKDVFVLVKEDLLKGLDVGGWIDGAQSYEVIPETVGQYTGMTDKNGKKIFEGDIIQSVESGETGEIQYFPEHTAFLIFVRGSNSYLDYLGEVKPSILKVIGNAHDNPELLKSIKEV